MAVHRGEGRLGHGGGDVKKRMTAPALCSDWSARAACARGGCRRVGRQRRRVTARRRLAVVSKAAVTAARRRGARRRRRRIGKGRAAAAPTGREEAAQSWASWAVRQLGCGPGREGKGRKKEDGPNEGISARRNSNF
uniref:Uncharacterized protein n=1 Tax=Oryza glumipatula TaxID=40148 RepID=A0A0E0BAG6_9ORYZ